MNDKKKYKILIIDDEKSILDMFTTKFKNEGFEVFTEVNGLNGLTSATKHKPDIILLDIMMPGIDGFETLRSFRQNTSLDVIIVIFTNLGNKQEDIDKAFEMGANEYMLKASFTPEEVFQSVMKLIKEKNKS